jgi:hypothetical protein
MLKVMTVALQQQEVLERRQVLIDVSNARQGSEQHLQRGGAVAIAEWQAKGRRGASAGKCQEKERACSTVTCQNKEQKMYAG